MSRQYFRNWSLFLRGFRWCFTQQRSKYANPNFLTDVVYKPGWGPWKFVLLVYWWDYGLACLLGRGVQSMSRAFTMFGKGHWKMTGGLLWGSVDLWR